MAIVPIAAGLWPTGKTGTELPTKNASRPLRGDPGGSLSGERLRMIASFTV